jgi:hypothetical protein
MSELFKGIYAYSFISDMMLLTVLFGLLVVAALNVLAGTGVLLCVGQPSQSFVVGVFVTSVLLLSRVWGVLCAAVV